MEPWVPQRPSQPQGRPMVPSMDTNRGLQSGHYRHRPHPQYSGDKYNQWQEAHRNSKPQQDPRTQDPRVQDLRADDQEAHYVPRPGKWSQPVSGVDYLGGPYPTQLYSRSGYEDPYQRYHTPTPREEYVYGNYYYYRHPQLLQEERVARQGSPYIWNEDSGDQKYFNERHREKRNSPYGTNSETQFQLTSKNPYEDSLASVSGQQQPGEFFPENDSQKQKPSLTGRSNLLQHQESGLSSSSYELSQYMADVPEYEPMGSATWRPIQPDDASAAVPKAPMKFYVPHVSVSFGPGGQLVWVSPNSPADGQTALVEVHSMEVILNDSEDQEEMRGFPGPLSREDIHKVDIMTFCQKKAAQCLKSETPGSRDSALLWHLLVLLCRQNGSMVGSDIAELLMQDCKKLEKYKRQPPVANLISLTDEDWPVLNSGTRNLLTGEIPPSVETPAQIVEKFTKLLYYGRKKEALEWAMKNHLWGHALFLASKMDPRTYNWVMSGFTSTLALNDPLQTLFQLLSGRIPQAATCCGDKQWGDWKPHLAVILSNQAGDTELYQRAIVSMGDTLAGKGLVEASHFCYLTAHVPFGHYTVKTDHLALLGSSHSQEFLKFATTEAIQRTEIFEYCQMLGRPKSFIPSFQVYKLLYASRLADYGLASQALHYCEAIGEAVLSQGGSSHPVLLAELIKLAEKLKLSDPLVLERRPGDRDLEPDWLVQLRRQHKELEQSKAGDLGDLGSTNSHIYGGRGTTDTSYQDLPGYQSYAGDPGYSSVPWPTPEQTGLTQPIPQQPLPPQRDPYSEREGLGYMGTPVPLYSVPATHLSMTSGDGSNKSVAVTGAPGARAGEEMLRIHPSLGENTAPQEPLQDPDGLEVVSSPQAPPAPRAQSFSEDSTVSAKEEEGGSSDGADEPSHHDTSQRGKPEDGKTATKSSGFGWFSWFRSKPANSTSPSGDEDSSGSSDSEQESPSTSPPHHTGLGLSPTPPLESPSLSDASTSSRGIGGSNPLGSLNSSGIAEVTGIGGFSGAQGVSSEFYSPPGALPPPPTLQGAVPLYNPSQVPQLSTATNLNRPNRLAQRRYPTQPC
ncbi:protein transport protein Sec16B isoform X1 [Microtus oregoni]|uniref:protein transport protein Sec16B isoform X1 n=1 Tax=Microtus oregoni TaxID=111838 RepID=UPI001BB22144|nr:protein transport protein Sec16B isoform X1 [Microtus oregoni]XP_041518571.1 protein transport protein Sec16B isoform X1 [Microtus oregoni]XP_041518572.1 protein transport protein Sec16B isoform X1 [Microtus oregoni]XP_041518573.1 protein transport protein Sec16B isoform X1 [Microtus oregoni]XP_041518574.1 protein transport protein Sec16B isoform X1 [Microtus oregoni]